MKKSVTVFFPKARAKRGCIDPDSPAKFPAGKGPRTGGSQFVPRGGAHGGPGVHRIEHNGKVYNIG